MFKGTSLHQLLQGLNLPNTLIGTLIKLREEEIAIIWWILTACSTKCVCSSPRCFLFGFLWWKDGDPVFKINDRGYYFSERL